MKSKIDFNGPAFPVGLAPDSSVVGHIADEISVLTEDGLAPVSASDVVLALELEHVCPEFFDGGGGDIVLLLPVALVTVGVAADREFKNEHCWSPYCFNHLEAQNQEVRHPLNLSEMARLSFTQRM
jgi:hypothetical protein